MYDFGTKHVSGAFMGAWTRGWIGDGVVDVVINTSMRYDFKLRWEVGVTRAFWGMDSPALILKNMKNYTLKDNFLRKVQCPTFVTGAGKSLYFDTEDHFPRISDQLAHLGKKRKLWRPNEPDQGSMQAKVGSWDLTNQKEYGFLDEVFGIWRPAILAL